MLSRKWHDVSSSVITLSNPSLGMVGMSFISKYVQASWSSSHSWIVKLSISRNQNSDRFLRSQDRDSYKCNRETFAGGIHSI